MRFVQRQLSFPADDFDFSKLLGYSAFVTKFADLIAGARYLTLLIKAHLSVRLPPFTVCST